MVGVTVKWHSRLSSRSGRPSKLIQYLAELTIAVFNLTIMHSFIIDLMRYAGIEGWKEYNYIINFGNLHLDSPVRYMVYTNIRSIV